MATTSYFYQPEEGGIDHVNPGRMDNGIHFRVNAPAEFIPFSTGDSCRLPGTHSDIDAVYRPASRPGISGRNDLVVLDDDRAQNEEGRRPALLGFEVRVA
jgi:hypothetical protein